MRYLLAILLPPVAVFLCWKPLQAVLNLVLCLFFYFPGAVHALLVVHDFYADKRADRMLRELEKHGSADVRALARAS